jgi:hypothetical protein
MIQAAPSRRVRKFPPKYTLSFTQVVQADFCNWGFAGPKHYRCDGVNYVYGSAADGSGFYRSLFCRDSLSDDCRDCRDDNAPATIACYNKMVASKQSKKESNEFCNWGIAGPKVITCNGQKYVYGTAACPSGIYSNIFCKEAFSYSGKACSDDNSPETIQCYNRFMRPSPPIIYNYGSGDRSNPAGAAR